MVPVSLPPTRSGCSNFKNFLASNGNIQKALFKNNQIRKEHEAEAGGQKLCCM